MKDLLAFDEFIKTSENQALEQLEPKHNSHKNIEHKFIHQFMNHLQSNLKNLYLEDNILISQELKEKLSDRTHYTLKKKSMDNITKLLFNETSEFTNNLYYKVLKKHSDFPLASLLNKNQMAYVYINLKESQFLKVSKKNKMIDPLDGSVYYINEYYQEQIKPISCFSLGEQNFCMKLDLYLGFIILQK